MRVSFIATLLELSVQDSRIMLLTGDLGYTVVEPFAERFPARFFNVGVAEQNMVGLATGLAEAGFIPFVYSIATFASMRPFEFIRNGPILHHLPVRIVGIGSGFEYGNAGPTHHALEDLGMMRMQPGITVIAPADVQQAQASLKASWDLPGPIYYRLSKNEKLAVPGLSDQFELGEAKTIREGDDILLVSMGGISSEVVKAAEKLSGQGIECAVVVVSSFNPAPLNDLAKLLGRHSKVVTVEEHYVVGGLGSLVSEIVAEGGFDCRVTRCGVRSPLEGVSGDVTFLREKHGLGVGTLIETVMRALQ